MVSLYLFLQACAITVHGQFPRGRLLPNLAFRRFMPCRELRAARSGKLRHRLETEQRHAGKRQPCSCRSGLDRRKEDWRPNRCGSRRGDSPDSPKPARAPHNWTPQSGNALAACPSEFGPA